MVIITAKRKGELMRKTSEKILRALLAVSVLATAVLSSGCLDDEEEISDSTASDNRQTSDGGNAESSEGSDNKYDGSVTGSRASKLTFSGSDGISIARKQREAEKPMGEDGTQTVFVYMCGSDLESENGLASGDIEEMIYLPLFEGGGYASINGSSSSFRRAVPERGRIHTASLPKRHSVML